MIEPYPSLPAVGATATDWAAFRAKCREIDNRNVRFGIMFGAIGASAAFIGIVGVTVAAALALASGAR